MRPFVVVLASICTDDETTILLMCRLAQLALIRTLFLPRPGSMQPAWERLRPEVDFYPRGAKKMKTNGTGG